MGKYTRIRKRKIILSKYVNYNQYLNKKNINVVWNL